jgi:hypothetical protein
VRASNECLPPFSTSSKIQQHNHGKGERWTNEERGKKNCFVDQLKNIQKTLIKVTSHSRLLLLKILSFSPPPSWIPNLLFIFFFYVKLNVREMKECRRSIVVLLILKLMMETSSSFWLSFLSECK